MSMDRRVIATILRKEISDAFRHRWFVLFAATFVILALMLSMLGMSTLGRLGITGFGRTAASLLHLVMVIVLAIKPSGLLGREA